MAKSGQHKQDANDPRISKGHNNPSKSQTITTGSYKKQETYQERAREHKDPEPQAQAQQNPWNEDTRDKPTNEGSTRARNIRSGRSGSSSNESDSASNR
jgi:hypothetical protein